MGLWIRLYYVAVYYIINYMSSNYTLIYYVVILRDVILYHIIVLYHSETRTSLLLSWYKWDDGKKELVLRGWVYTFHFKQFENRKRKSLLLTFSKCFFQWIYRIKLKHTKSVKINCVYLKLQIVATKYQQLASTERIDWLTLLVSQTFRVFPIFKIQCIKSFM